MTEATTTLTRADLQAEQAAWDKQMGRKSPEEIDQMLDELMALAKK